MSENKCPKCGVVLKSDRQRFCDQCGWNFTGDSNQEGSSQPAQTTTQKDTSTGLALDIDKNQFYMEGFSGVIHLKVENLTTEPFDLVEIELVSDIPVKSKSFDFHLAPGKSKERRFQLSQIRSKGPKAISFKVKAAKANRVSEYRAEATLHVLERIEDARQILSHTGGVDLGRSSEKFNIGGVINIDVKNMIDRGQIKTANDLMQEYSNLAADFHPLNLEFVARRQVPKPRRLWPWIVAAAVVIISCFAGLTMRQRNIRRGAAMTARTEVETARQAAMDAQAETDALHLWKEAETSYSVANEAFEKGFVEKAKLLWEKATAQYVASQAYANGAARVRSAKEKYEAALDNYDVGVLKQYGGQPWTDVVEAITFARAAGDDFDKAVQWYQRAIELLPAAWEWAKGHVPPEPPLPPKIYSFDEGIKQLIVGLENSVSETREVLLNRIVGADGVRTQFDVVLENRMFLELQTSEKIQLLGLVSAGAEPSPLQATISRNQQGSSLVLSGVVADSGKVTRVGQVQVEIDDYLHRLLSKVAATREEVRKNPKLKPDVIEVPPLALTYSITGLHNSAGTWESVAVSSGSSLNSGDCFKINFKTNEDCFIYVLLYGSAGIAQCLFPHAKISLDNNVKGDSLYSLPDGENWYYLDNMTGTETIYLVACYEPMKNVAGVLAKMEQADPDRQRSFSRDIQQKLSDIQTRGLESDRYVINQSRGVSGIAPAPKWNLKHEGHVIEAVTEIVRGAGSIVKVVGFEHK